MIIQEKRDYLNEQDVMICIFENPSFDKSLLGLSEDSRAIYDYNQMVKEYMEDNNCDEEEAIEFIDYNTLRSYPGGEIPAPIILFPLQID